VIRTLYSWSCWLRGNDVIRILDEKPGSWKQCAWYTFVNQCENVRVDKIHLRLRRMEKYKNHFCKVYIFHVFIKSICLMTKKINDKFFWVLWQNVIFVCKLTHTQKNNDKQIYLFSRSLSRTVSFPLFIQWFFHFRLFVCRKSEKKTTQESACYHFRVSPKCHFPGVLHSTRARVVVMRVQSHFLIFNSCIRIREFRFLFGTNKYSLFCQLLEQKNWDWLPSIQLLVE
jgi:hypothetical protein